MKLFYHIPIQYHQIPIRKCWFQSINQIISIYLSIDFSKIKERTTLYPNEPSNKLSEYNKQIEKETFDIYEKFNIPHYIVKNNGDINKTLEDVMHIIDNN